MKNPAVLRMGYFRVRIRTHEWVERQRVSLLDVKRIGKVRMNLLYKHKLSTASKIMETPIEQIVACLCEDENAPKNDPEPALRKMVEDWRQQIRGLWRSDVGEPLPTEWAS